MNSESRFPSLASGSGVNNPSLVRPSSSMDVEASVDPTVVHKVVRLPSFSTAKLLDSPFHGRIGRAPSNKVLGNAGSSVERQVIRFPPCGALDQVNSSIDCRKLYNLLGTEGSAVGPQPVRMPACPTASQVKSTVGRRRIAFEDSQGREDEPVRMPACPTAGSVKSLVGRRKIVREILEVEDCEPVRMPACPTPSQVKPSVRKRIMAREVLEDHVENHPGRMAACPTAGKVHVPFGWRSGQDDSTSRVSSVPKLPSIHRTPVNTNNKYFMDLRSLEDWDELIKERKPPKVSEKQVAQQLPSPKTGTIRTTGVPDKQPLVPSINGRFKKAFIEANSSSETDFKHKLRDNAKRCNVSKTSTHVPVKAVSDDQKPAYQPFLTPIGALPLRTESNRAAADKIQDDIGFAAAQLAEEKSAKKSVRFDDTPTTFSYPPEEDAQGPMIPHPPTGPKAEHGFRRKYRMADQAKVSELIDGYSILPFPPPPRSD